MQIFLLPTSVLVMLLLTAMTMACHGIDRKPIQRLSPQDGDATAGSNFRTGVERDDGHGDKDNFLGNSVFFHAETPADAKPATGDADVTIVSSVVRSQPEFVTIENRKAPLDLGVMRVCSNMRTSANAGKNFRTMADNLSLVLAPADKAMKGAYQGSGNKVLPALFTESVLLPFTDEMKASLINEGNIKVMVDRLPDGDYIIDACNQAEERCLGFHAVDMRAITQTSDQSHRVTITNGIPVSGANTGFLYDENRGSETGCDQRASPLMIDFYNTGITLSAPLGGISFDIDVDKELDTISWVQSDGTGIVVLDVNRNGIIDDGSELFGDHSAHPNFTARPANGFEALARYDSNGDGWINAEDSIYGDLRVWIDRNRDGKSDTDELYTLREKGVAAFDLDYRDMNQLDQYGNATKQRSVVRLTTGEFRMIFDIWFRKVFRVTGT